jgi:hypothetical protein
VVLAVENMAKGATYTIRVNNVRDLHGLSIPFNSTAQFIYDYFVEISASDAGDGHPAEHSMDGDMATYWSALGTSGVWIQYDLRTKRLVQSVEIAFYLGDRRKSYFAIETSVDGTTWTEVYNGESSGQSLELQLFDFEDVWARYVRILGFGNSIISDWNSYTEVDINYLSATGTGELDSGVGLKVYPQPATNGIHVVFPGWKQETDIWMVNVLGKVDRARLTGESTWIPTGHLEPGLYILVIWADGKVFQKKMLIGD